MDISSLLVNSTLLRDLNCEEVFSFFDRLSMKPEYMVCQSFNKFSMQYDKIILDHDCEKNKVLVIDSPNFPNAGKGLINNRAQAISKESGLPYWGQLFVVDFIKQNIEAVVLNEKLRERMVELSFQPFLHIGLRLFVVGSLSCAASYSNDANFKGWSAGHNSDSTNFVNNCFLREYSPLDENTVKGFVAWLQCCPIWIITSHSIKYGEEFLTKYF